jgi:chromosome segregation ATPase
MAAAPGEDITIRGLTWPKLLTIIGAILGGAGAIIWVLIGLVYGGIQEKIDSKAADTTKSVDALTKRVESVEQTFRTAVTAGISVQDLLARAPRLEATINETHDAALGLKAQLQALQQTQNETHDVVVGHTQQLQTIQQSVTQLSERLPRPR